MLDDTYKVNVLKDLDNGLIFVGEYEDVKSIIEFKNGEETYLPYYKILKIYKLNDDIIIEAPIRR